MRYRVTVKYCVWKKGQGGAEDRERMFSTYDLSVVSDRIDEHMRVWDQVGYNANLVSIHSEILDEGGVACTTK